MKPITTLHPRQVSHESRRVVPGSIASRMTAFAGRALFALGLVSAAPTSASATFCEEVPAVVSDRWFSESPTSLVPSSSWPVLRIAIATAPDSADVASTLLDARVPADPQWLVFDRDAIRKEIPDGDGIPLASEVSTRSDVVAVDRPMLARDFLHEYFGLENETERLVNSRDGTVVMHPGKILRAGDEYVLLDSAENAHVFGREIRERLDLEAAEKGIRSSWHRHGYIAEQIDEVPVSPDSSDRSWRYSE